MSRLRTLAYLSFLLAIVVCGEAARAAEEILVPPQIPSPVNLGAYADGASALDVDGDAQFPPAFEVLGWGSLGEVAIVCDRLPYRAESTAP